ncbi:acetylcholinesterase-like [Bacillus rossius redtenbacheri]|uniref:acetylcholinesterase-like n=1 Tax=Bacillus rossius redtenbacheri TaxID=93214 RepID=UPI002FDE24C3
MGDEGLPTHETHIGLQEGLPAIEAVFTSRSADARRQKLEVDRKEGGGAAGCAVPATHRASPAAAMLAAAMLAAALPLLGAALAAAGPPLARTSSGSLAGLELPTAAGPAAAYLGVRYAAPPLRFRPPQPPPAAPDRRVDATRFGAACYQPPHLTELMYPQLTLREKDRNVSEDCLFLNIYSPARPSEGAPRAVMVWLPGEGFSFADAAQFDGSHLAVRGDVIVVTVNYRVGVFGFLSTRNSSAPGNLGLMDVVQALRWVRLNAAALGGDPERVTLFGRFTGAMLASLLLTSPRLLQRAAGAPRPLVARVVLQSGVASSGYVLDPDPGNRTAALARLAACTGPHEQVMRCLRELPAERLDELSWKVPRLWRPHVDGDLVPADPLVSARRRSYHRFVQVLLGETSGEGSLCLLQHFFLETEFAQPILADNVTRREFARLVQEHVYDYLKVKDPSVLEATQHEYRPWPPDSGSYRDHYLRLCGALYTRVRSEQLARWLARSGSAVWRYEFAHRPSASHHPPFMGAAHGDEVLFVFGLLDPGASPPDELRLQERVIAAWTNFAKTGNPNPVPGGDWWPQFLDEGRQMYVLAAPNDSVKSSEFLSRDLDFWGAVVPRLLRHAHRARQHPGTTPAPPCGSTTSLPLLVLSLVLATALLLICYYLFHRARPPGAALLHEMVLQ